MKPAMVTILLSIFSHFFAAPEEKLPVLGHDFTVTQFVSDYRYTLSWENLFEEYCLCSQVRTIKAAKNDFQNPALWFTLDDVGITGSSIRNVGPNATQTLYITVYYSGNGGFACLFDCSTFVDLFNSITGTTSPIYAPSNVMATDGDEYDDRVIITWTKETDIPNNRHSYRIYRDGILIGQTADGGTNTFTDSGLSPDETHNYAVTTYTDDFGIHESSQNAPGAHDIGSTFGVGLIASDGDFYNRAKLSWNDLSGICTDIRVERSIPESMEKEEIAILNGNATTYNDQDGIPGYTYTYYVTPIGGSNLFETDSDSGYSRPNGKISGHVRSQLNAGVSGVDIYVTLLDSIPVGGFGLPPACAQTYCAITNAEGYYEIKDIYYFDGANFRVEPFKTGIVPHEFTPDSSVRSLDEISKIISGVDFTDLTVFTVGGRITYPESPNFVTCGVTGVKILVDDQDYGIFSDSDGEWTFTIQDEGSYDFEPVFLHHQFEDGEGNEVTTLFINGDNTDIDFEDIQTDDLLVVVQGGCESSLGDAVEVHVTAPENCFNEIYYTDANGILLIEDLPARDYSVEVTDIIDPGNPNISTIMDQIGFQPFMVDLMVRDTGQTIHVTDTTIITPMMIDTLPNDSIIVIPADTMMTTLYDTVYGDVAPSVRFIYRSPLDVSTDFEDAGAEILPCLNSEGDPIILMEQGLSYTLQIEVKEILGMDCYIDTGYLRIYDFVSDRGSKVAKVPILGGIATYVIEAGVPNVASNPLFHDHEKLLYIIPEVNLVDPVPVEYWVFVTGAKLNTPSFITRSPEIPMVILHDPPGDNSSSFIEQGTSINLFSTSEVLIGGGGGIYSNLLIGGKAKTPFFEAGASLQIKFDAEYGHDNFNRSGLFTKVTFTERFSTSDIENLTGNDGDVYIGAAFNQEYSLAESLTFDMDSCKGDVDILPALSSQDFATTFIYTEKHIRNTLLPTMGFIKDNILDGQDFNSLSMEDQIRVNNLIGDSILWENILRDNNRARDSLAEFKENISFSAGAPISRETTNDSMFTFSHQYNNFVNATLAIGAKVTAEGGVWHDSEFGVMGKFRWAWNRSDGLDSTLTRKVGYVLSDNDIGDFISVDILQDTFYDVPAFKLKLGTTSCPQEPGTQARDKATIQVFPPELTNIPLGEPANFVCQITNTSESFETREYGVRLVSTTNPDGLNASLAGQGIVGGEATFFLEPNQTQNLLLSFDQGPLASTYENLAIMVYPVCEYALWQDNGTLTNADTAWVQRIEWQTHCTNISLSLPDDGWLVNQQSNNTIHCALTGYDLYNPLFESMSLQIKKEGEGYVDQFTIEKADIQGPFYDIFLDVTNFNDGDYRLRAKAHCGAVGGTTYSSEKLGTIDRTLIAPFGIPTPSDGFLREGQEVSVTFDKQINCNINSYPHEITLIREDNQQPLPFTTSCSGNKIIINTSPPLIDQLNLEGVLVTAHVAMLQDLNGNVQAEPTEWSFLVNVSPVFWDPKDLEVAGHEGQMNVITAVLKNTSLLSKPFSLEPEDAPLIIEYPGWLTPVQSRGTILPNNDFMVQFEVSDDLTPGIYTGIISAMVDSLPVSMNLTFELLAKSVNWNFSPADYQYSMIVVAQFSLDGSDNNLSMDTRDIVGAFVNGQVRGLANIEYVPQLNIYRAFLTIYSNNQGGQNGETIKFKFWRALTGVEYGALETVVFTLDNSIGTASSPFILHPEGFFQQIPLDKGWNWISLNVSNANMSREHIFENLLNSPNGNSITVKSKTQTAQYNHGAGWSGNLSTLQLGAGYLLYLSNAPDTLHIVGLPSASAIVVNVSGNWNWIGFPRLTPESVDDVLSDLTPAQGNILKSQDEFSHYDAGVDSWIGSLNNFVPGDGYKLYLSSPGIIFFEPSRNDEYEFDPFLYEYNMNVTGFADLDVIGEHIEEDFIVGAFIDGECRGIGSMEWIEALHEYRVIMLVNGNIPDFGKSIEFRFKNEMTGIEYVANGESLFFTADALIGSVENPYLFFSFSTGIEEGIQDGYHLEQCRPNPASQTTEIGFRIPESQQVFIHLYDVSGKLLKTVMDQVVSAGRHSVKVDLVDMPAGVYFYEMKTNTFTGVKKLIRE